MNPSPSDHEPNRVFQAETRVAVLGATGSVGREVVAQALANGDAVTALVRAQPRPGEIDDRVAVVVGDVTDLAAVSRVVDGSDAVVSALGHAKRSPDDVLARATANVIAAMRANDVDRLVVLSSPAVGDAADRPGLFYRAAGRLLRIVMPGMVRDHREQARLVEQSGLAWTLVRGPLIFTDGPHTGRYQAGPITRRSSARISRADLAGFMLATAADDEFVHMKPLVSASGN
jgi:putative NADH-flavin reductase